MKKQLLLASLLTAANFNAQAQQATTLTSAPITSASRTDSVQAIHQLFSKHRTGGVIWSAIGVAFAVRIITVASTSNSDAASGTAAGTAVGVGVFGGVPAGIGVGKLLRFSNMRETEAVTACEQGKTLPKYIQRRLKSKYFNR